MAFNPYFPASYAVPYQYQPQQTQAQGGLIWVQGIEAAKSHPVSAGQSVLLMDSESNCFFIKSADASGMPLPLRIFDYSERHSGVQAANRRTEGQDTMGAYITREEFERRLESLLSDCRAIVSKGESNAERIVPDTGSAKSS